MKLESRLLKEFGRQKVWSRACMTRAGLTTTAGVYFHSLEGFRAVAVILVLLQHHTLLSKTYLGVEFAWGLFSRGQFRMDIFFLLSGFFAAWRERHKQVAAPSGVEFFVRRMFRLLPLLWILTSAKLILILMSEGGGRHDGLSCFDILRSYTMLPAAGYPVLLPAWTLSFELVFCTLWSVLLYLSVHARRRLLFVWALWIAFNAWGTGKPSPDLPGFILHPYFLDFIGGALLGQAIGGPCRWSWSSRGFILGGCVVLAVGLAFDGELQKASEFARRLVWGGGTGLLLAGILGWEMSGRKLVMPPFLRFTARASYSIYLSHSLVLVAILPSLRALLPQSSSGVQLVLLAVAMTAYGVGLLVFWLVEKPVMHWLSAHKFLGLRAKEFKIQH
jgi:exopolysaccharide production protein ExoZ